MERVEDKEKKGKLFVISGPSGVGKTSLIEDVLERLDGFVKSISVTTRPRRENEINGVQYRFVTEKEFMELVDKDLLLEWAWYAGYLYGTPKDFVLNELSSGRNVILEIEVKGAMQIKSKIKDAYLIFITVPSLKSLEERLKKRGTNNLNEIRKRIEIAKEELKYEKYYDCIIINNNYNEALYNLEYVLNLKGGRCLNESSLH
ncbi:MAG: guanylate kinase [Actinobacteria bacterium]|nr:guanylate kinase [Actinomycetota bacterium]